MPSRSPFGARMQWPEPAHTKQSLARPRPTKGGAVRIRIALSTATVVSITSTAFFTFMSALPAASAKNAVHHATQSHHTSLFTLSDSSLAAFAAPITVNGPAVEVGGTPIANFSSTTPGPPPPPPPPPVPLTDANSPYTRNWMCIRIHESGNVYNSAAEPSGAYGILYSTWHAFGYAGWPYQAAPVVQDHLAMELYSLYGFRPWSSRFACGL